MEIAGKNHVVRKHDFIFLPPGVEHAISNSGLVDWCSWSSLAGDRRRQDRLIFEATWFETRGVAALLTMRVYQNDLILRSAKRRSKDDATATERARTHAGFGCLRCRRYRRGRRWDDGCRGRAAEGLARSRHREDGIRRRHHGMVGRHGLDSRQRQNEAGRCRGQPIGGCKLSRRDRSGKRKRDLRQAFLARGPEAIGISRRNIPRFGCSR